MDQGTYRAKAIDFDFGVAGTGTDQIAICFELTEGDCEKEQINWYGYFTEGTAERTIKTLRDLGWTGDNLATMGIEDLSEEVSLVIEEDERGSLKVKWVNTGGGVALKTRMSNDQKNAFAARMRGFCMAKPGDPAPQRTAPKTGPNPQPRAQQRSAPKPRQPGQDDDMPPWVTDD